jgi:hypothetical protein
MDNINLDKSNGLSRLKRKDLLILLNTAIQVQSYRFARQTIEAWEAEYPGDIEMKYYLALCFFGEKRTDRAELNLRELIGRDIENLEAYRLFQDKLPEKVANLKIPDTLFILGEDVQNLIVSENGRLIRESIELREQNNIEGSSEVLYPILSGMGNYPLAALTHLRLEEKKGENLAVLNLAKVYSSRFPDCL